MPAGVPTPPLHAFASPIVIVFAIVITVFALVRALLRGRTLWVVIILATGPFGAIAYWIASSLSDMSGPGGSVSNWPPRPRR